MDECLLQPNACQNGGTCTNRNGDYGCVCVNGWSGDDCSENIDDCAFASCTPGSTCIDRVASFSCMCPEGKAGKARVAQSWRVGRGVWASIQGFCRLLLRLVARLPLGLFFWKYVLLKYYKLSLRIWTLMSSLCTSGLFLFQNQKQNRATKSLTVVCNLVNSLG